MAKTVVDCNEGIRLGQYDACDALDEDYPEFLDRFVDLAGESETNNDDDAGERLQESKQTQKEFRDRVQEYRETKDAYEKAKTQGNESRARELARRLNTLATQANESSTNLTRTYTVVANQTPIQTAPAVDDITAVTRNVTSTAQRIRRTEFVNTTLTATATREQISSVQPLAVTGRLRSENGTGLSGQQIVLRAGPRRIRTTTNATGGFDLSYRPIVLPLETTAVALRFTPVEDSFYLGDRMTLPVEVKGITPQVSVSATPKSIGFGDSLSVRGRVTASSSGLPSVPVMASLAGQRLGQTPTGPDGTFQTTLQIPAGIPAGTQTLRIGPRNDSRAVGAQTSVVNITVVSTPTTLSITGDTVENSDGDTGTARISVQGALRTETGVPVPEQPIQIQNNGTVLQTIRTNPNGTFSGEISLPSALLSGDSGNRSLVLNASYGGRNTNLGPAQAETTVSVFLTSTGSSPSSDPQSDPNGGLLWWQWVAILVGGTGVVVFLWQLGGLTLLREGLDGNSSGVGTDELTDVTPTAQTESTSSRGRDPLSGAREYVDQEDPSTAIQTTYSTIRDHIGANIEDAASMTHWEFFTACQQDGFSEDRLAALQTVTEAYEVAAFAPSQPTIATADRVLQAATALIED